MNTVKFYVEIEIPNTLEDIGNMFSFVKEKEDEMTTRHDSPISTTVVFTGKIKDSDGYFVTNDSPYLLGGCWPVSNGGQYWVTRDGENVVISE